LQAVEMAAKRIIHWRNVLKPGSGGAPYDENSMKTIRFVRMGCANRPFYHIVVAEVIERGYLLKIFTDMIFYILPFSKKLISTSLSLSKWAPTTPCPTKIIRN